MSLPTDVDSTYPDDPNDPAWTPELRERAVREHQQAHDSIAVALNQTVPGLAQQIAQIAQQVASAPVYPALPAVRSLLVYDPSTNPPFSWVPAGSLGGAAGDTTPPSAPGTVTAAAAGNTSVTVSWTAATDNVGVAGYQLLNQAGTQIGSDLPSTARAATVENLAAGSYVFGVRAFDGANPRNLGPVKQSASVTVTGTQPPETITYNSDGFARSDLQVSKSAYTTAEQISVTATILYDPARAAHTQLDDWGVAVRRVDPSTNAVISADDASLDFAHQNGQTTSTWTNRRKTMSATRSLTAGKYELRVFYKKTGVSTYPRVGAPVYFTVTAASTDPGNPGVPSGTWLSGASGMGVDNESASTGSFATWRGTPLGVTATWADGSDSVQRSIPSLAAYYKNWQASIDIAPGMIVAGESFASARNGAYNSRWTAGLQVMRSWWQARQNPSQVKVFIRLAHEMNGNWYPWKVTSSNYTDFIAAWKVYRSLQKQHFPEAVLVFCVNRESVASGIDWRKTFPGKEFVDCGGVDYYNQYPWVNDSSAWNSAINQSDGYGAPKGLQKHQQFWQSVGLPWGIGEWSSNASMGDADQYPKLIRNFFKANAGTGSGNLWYEVFFNHNKENAQWHITGSGVRHPKFAAAYRNEF